MKFQYPKLFIAIMIGIIGVSIKDSISEWSKIILIIFIIGMTVWSAITEPTFYSEKEQKENK